MKIRDNLSHISNPNNTIIRLFNPLILYPINPIIPSLTMEKASRIYIAGHRGLVGSAILRRLAWF